MNNALEICKEFDDFCDYSLEELRKQFKGMLTSTGMILKKNTIKILGGKLPSYNKKNKKYNDTLKEGVRLSVLKNRGYGESEEAFVHVMGTRASGSGTYRLRFFEGGTQDRTPKTGPFKGKNIGHITALNFFADAISQSKSAMESNMHQRLTSVIDKINETRK